MCASTASLSEGSGGGSGSAITAARAAVATSAIRRGGASGAKLGDAMERRVTKLAEERACIRENVAAVMRKANELFAEDE